MKHGPFVLALGLAASLAGPATAQSAADVDRAFIVAATQGNDAEIDMAQIVLQRGKMDEALAYARLMVTDHSALAARFAAVVPPGAAVVPERENAADRVALARLAALAQPDLDQEYLVQQVGDHLATVMVFTTEARQGTNPALKAFAKKELPMLQEHLQLAIANARRVSGDNPLR